MACSVAVQSPPSQPPPPLALATLAPKSTALTNRVNVWFIGFRADSNVQLWSQLYFLGGQCSVWDHWRNPRDCGRNSGQTADDFCETPEFLQQNPSTWVVATLFQLSALNLQSCAEE